MPSVIIIYGSSAGNTELVCEHVAEILKTKGVDVTLQRVERSTVNDIQKADLCILAAPTYEHGVIQTHFIPFLKALKKLDLKKHPMAVIGLGDPKYDDHYHIESANILTAAVKQANGNLVCHTLRVSGEPLLQTERIKKWAESLVRTMLSEEEICFSQRGPEEKNKA